MKRRLFSASLHIRSFAAEHFLFGGGRWRYYAFVGCRRLANGLEDLSRGRFPRFDKED